MPQSFRLLLVAQSARMLAESAARAGWQAFTIDLFGDEDTQAASQGCLTLPADPAGMNEAALLEAAHRLAPADGNAALVYGSGIDTRPEVVEKLVKGRVCFGNSPQTLRRINNPPAFFELLAHLDIPHPITRFTAPATPEGWLVKGGCSEGGKSVRLLANNRPAGPAEYYQRLLPGPPLSALFLADGQDIHIIGFNTLWLNDDHPQRRFGFRGVINRANLDETQRAKVTAYALKLTRAVALVGLNSLDFVLEGTDVRVLEVNPRPSASMALYDEDYPKGLLAAHIAACRGTLVPSPAQAGPVRAFCIVQAPHAVRIHRDVSWPDWCADRPCPGSVIGAGEPICSVRAQAQDLQTTEALLHDREARVLANFVSSTGVEANPAVHINAQEG